MSEPNVNNLPDFESEYPLLFSAIRKVVPGSMKIWLVGGAVRDIMLKRKIRDFDFTVEGLVRPIGKHIADKVNGAYYVLDDEREMVRVVVSDPEMGTLDIDIALLSGNSIEDDLILRDFTFNAMAIALEQPPRLIDPLNGMKDFENKVLHMCNPQSLDQDPLRAFRAIRMSLEFNLNVDEELDQAMKKVPPYLHKSSFERYRDELFKIIRLKKNAKAAEMFKQYGYLEHILPGYAPANGSIDLKWLEDSDFFLSLITDRINKPEPDNDYAVFAASRIGNFSESLYSFFDKSLALYHSRRMLTAFASIVQMFSGNDPQLIKAWCGRLAFSSAETGFVLMTCRAYDFLSKEFNTNVYNDVDIYRYFNKFKEGGISGLILYLADNYQRRGLPNAYKEWCRRVVAAENLVAAYFSRYMEVIAPVPLLSGNQIQSVLNIPAGPIIGQIKNDLIEAQISGTVKTPLEAESFIRQHAG